MKKTSAGQSLVEVVVAIGVMSLLLMALLALVSLSVKNSRVARDLSRLQLHFTGRGGRRNLRTCRQLGGGGWFGDCRLRRDKFYGRNRLL